jgi:hypothetical protein
VKLVGIQRRDDRRLGDRRDQRPADRFACQMQGILAEFKSGDTIWVTWVSPAGHQITSPVHLTRRPHPRRHGMIATWP